MTVTQYFTIAFSWASCVEVNEDRHKHQRQKDSAIVVVQTRMKKQVSVCFVPPHTYFRSGISRVLEHLIKYSIQYSSSKKLVSHSPILYISLPYMKVVGTPCAGIKRDWEHKKFTSLSRPENSNTMSKTLDIYD